jgi:hypothetical protein
MGGKQAPSLVVNEGSEALIVAFGAGVLPAGNRRRQLAVIHCRSRKPEPALDLPRFRGVLSIWDQAV